MKTALIKAKDCLAKKVFYFFILEQLDIFWNGDFNAKIKSNLLTYSKTYIKQGSETLLSQSHT